MTEKEFLKFLENYDIECVLVTHTLFTIVDSTHFLKWYWEVQVFFTNRHLEIGRGETRSKGFDDAKNRILSFFKISE